METTEIASELPASDTASYWDLVSKGLYLVLGFFSFVLNLICALVILKERLHSNENRFFFMASLAVADTTLGLSLLVVQLVELISVDKICSSVGTILLETAIVADVLCLCLLTCDQFMRIILHMRYPVYATFRNACIALSVVVCICLGHAILAVAMRAEGSVSRCPSTYGDPTYDYTHGKWFYVYDIICYFILPLLAIIFMHGWILHVSRKQMKRLRTLAPMMRGAGNPARRKCGSSCQGCHDCGEEQGSPVSSVCPCGHDDHSQARRQWRAVITISVLVGVLLCTWVPAYTVMALQTIIWPGRFTCADCHVMRTLSDVTAHVYFVNPLLNSFIYTARVPEIKKQIRRLIRCRPWA